MSTPSLSERLAQRRLQRLRGWLLGLGAAVLLVGLFAAAWFSPLLQLRAVDVEGAALTEPSEITAAVLDAHAGTPLPQIRLSRLEQELLTAFPKAREIEVRWGGLRTLHVEVIDRTPVLAAPVDGGWVRYDAEGLEIDTVRVAPSDVPLLVLDGVDDVPAAITAAVSFIAQIPADAQSHIVSMEAGSAYDLRLVYEHEGSEVTVVFGSAEDVERKLRTAQALLSTGARHIDVSVPGVPVAR